MKQTFLIPDVSGHSTLKFDTLKPESLASAEAKFNELVQDKKKSAYARGEGGAPSRLLRSYDPTAPATVFFDQLRGG